MFRKFTLLLAACALCQCNARAPAGDSAPPSAPAAPEATEAPAQAPEEEAPGAPSEDKSPTELPKSAGSDGAEIAPAPAKRKPALDPTPKDSKTRAMDGLDFASLSDAEAALKSADQRLSALYLVAGKASQLADNDERCGRACGAFSSLERAAEGVCRLAGESDPRCSKARGRVAHHKPKIAACSCPGD